ncbi:hypothetical protein D3C73_1423590 [compost metagenome]
MQLRSRPVNLKITVLAGQVHFIPAACSRNITHNRRQLQSAGNIPGIHASAACRQLHIALDRPDTDCTVQRFSYDVP